MSDRLVMLGGGPAGLSAGYVLSKARRPAVVVEATSKLGGISRTEQYKGYRFDLGGHRFFTKFDEVQRLWEEVLGSDLLVRPRMSRIYYRGKFYDYPLKASNALRNLGPFEAIRCVMSYGAARVAGGGGEAVTFEEWVSSRFGKRLFQIFFKTYTEKVWGIPCNEIAAAWAAQRIKNLSLAKAAWNALFPSREVIASLIEQFHYPRLGPGMMYERMGEKIAGWGGEVVKDQKVVAVRRDGFRVTAVKTRGPDGEQEIPGAAFISSIPLPELVRIMDPPPPDDVLKATEALRFRYMITINVMVDQPNLFPDNWIYVHEPGLQVARVQNFGNWSPEMVPDAATSCLALEYMVYPDQPLWQMSDTDLLALGSDEIARTGLLGKGRVKDGAVVRIPDAYPVYRIGFEPSLDLVISWLRQFENLQEVGRGGMFKYNNADHSILTALLAVENLDGAKHDLWAVNTDSEYHEIRKPG